MKTCVFAGTFDPFTTGHEYVANKSLQLFDKVIIAIGVNGDKEPFFSVEDRVNLLKKIYENNENVEIATFSGLLVDFMKEKGLNIYVRGVRNEEDYKYESTMLNFNQDFYPELTTVYIPTPDVLEHVSSTAIRSLIKMGADFEKYVPLASVKEIKKIIGSKK